MRGIKIMLLGIGILIVGSYGIMGYGMEIFTLTCGPLGLLICVIGVFIKDKNSAETIE